MEQAPGALSQLAMLFRQPYALTTLLSGVLAALLGAFVLWKTPRSPIGRMWAVLCFSIAGWAVLFSRSLLCITPEDSIFYLRVADAFALFIPVTYLHFVMYFTGNLRPLPLKFAYLCTGLLLVTVPTPWFIREGQLKFGMWFEKGGPAFAAFAALYAGLTAYGMALIHRQIRRAIRTRRIQLTCLLLASVLGLGGGFMWFLPSFNLDIPPLGGHLVVLYFLIMMFAIVRYRFLDIQVVMRRSLVYSISVTLLTAGYFGLVYAMEKLLQATLGYASVGVTAAAFALMTLLFQPLKIGIQSVLDRLIFHQPRESLIRRVERLEEETREMEKLKAVRTLAAGLCHELRNPLQAIQTHAEFLPERYDDPRFRRRCSAVMRGEITRINDLLRQLMEFAKPKPPAFRPVSPRRVLDSTLDLLSNDFLQRGVRLEKQYQANGAQVQADADQLRQVILNLLLNALQATPEGGRVTVRTREEKGWYVLEVADTGPGIDPRMMPKLFEPFNTSKPEGTGLGLSIAHSIVREHRGKIAVRSIPGEGAVFTLHLPAD